MIIYTIRDPETKLFSKGGVNPTFTKKGKIWAGMGALKNHLNFALQPWHYRSDKRVIIDDDFIPYMRCQLIITNTEDLTTVIDDNFIPQYLQQKALKIAKEENREIAERTREILCL